MTTPAPKTPPSPTPWKCNPVPSTGTAGIVTGDGRLVGVVDIADGPRIALAVNEYEGLVAFVRKAAKMFPEGEDSHAVRVEARAILARIEAARG